MDEHIDDVPRPIPAIGYYPKKKISMGTTIIAIQYSDGVVVGSDSRTSRGSVIACRTTDKITPITDKIVVSRSGSAADTQAISDIVNFYGELYGLFENKKLSVYRTVQLFREFLYDYRDQLEGSVIVSGWDEKEGAQIYAIPLGGYCTRQKFAASGSGSTFVTGYLDKQWKPNITLEEAKELIKNSICLASYRDGSSGGVIRLCTINKDGTQRELFRPDGKAFPNFFVPTPYLSWPKHVVESKN